MAQTADWRDPAPPIDERVEAHLAAITTEEKLTQLGGYWHEKAEDQGQGEAVPIEHPEI